MKKFKAFLVTLIMTLTAISVLTLVPENYEAGNLSIKEKKEIISDIAREYDIPPEILKAIAYEETGYKQFNEDGSPYISTDGGIGIMQVTPGNIDFSVNEEKLKTDIRYNIEVGAKVLDNKWDLDTPKINNGSRHILENWYFAIAAYNGLSRGNDPNVNSGDTYQFGVYKRIEGASLIFWDESPDYVYFDFPKFDINYEDGDNRMHFPEGKSYVTETVTPSQQMYEQGDIVYIDERDGSVSFYKGEYDGNPDKKLWPYTPLTIKGEPQELNDIDNDYVYYKVESAEDTGQVASAYLNKESKDLMFSDPIDDKRAAALAFAAMNDYVQGYQDGSFGSKDKLRREHVAVILDNILNLSAPDSYEMISDDVKKTNDYYEQLREVEYHKFLGGGGELRPNEYLTRSQMAQVMTEAFDSYYSEPTETHTFKDQGKIWNSEAVNKIYQNDITVADPFRPNEDITRSQFAIFIYRTMVDF
ncbi:hypothetical protein GCM10008986_10320 [Salinibacillus aidingensis]|uniref:SLH domain-containing protein n=1 Tax=Salinibacillus aidingensis TaxID=237684 RepID=A0ABP3KU20_9BACI